VGQIQTLAGAEGSRSPLEEGEPVREPRRAQRLGELGADRIVTSHDERGQRELVRQRRDVHDPEPGDRDAAEDDGLERGAGPKAADPGNEILRRALTINRKLPERHRFDPVGPFHHHADEGHGAGLALVERGVVYPEDVRS
jgi:hypothetical protein